MICFFKRHFWVALMVLCFLYWVLGEYIWFGPCAGYFQGNAAAQIWFSVTLALQCTIIAAFCAAMSTIGPWLRDGLHSVRQRVFVSQAEGVQTMGQSVIEHGRQVQVLAKRPHAEVHMTHGPRRHIGQYIGFGTFFGLVFSEIWFFSIRATFFLHMSYGDAFFTSFWPFLLWCLICVVWPVCVSVVLVLVPILFWVFLRSVSTAGCVFYIVAMTAVPLVSFCLFGCIVFYQ